MRRLDSVRYVHHITFSTPLIRPRGSECLSRTFRVSPIFARPCIRSHGFDQAFRTITGLSKLQRPASISQRDSYPVRIPIGVFQYRIFATTRHARDVQRTTAGEEKSPTQPQRKNGNDNTELAERAFAKTEKASRAAQVNLSARLSQDGASSGKSAGFREVWRLLRIARPEAKWLGSMDKIKALHNLLDC